MSFAGGLRARPGSPQEIRDQIESAKSVARHKESIAREEAAKIDYEKRLANPLGMFLGDVGTWGAGVSEDISRATLGKSFAEMGASEGGLLGAAQDIQGDLFRGGIGNIAGGFGVEPRTLLIIGVIAAVGIIGLIVVTKL